MVVFNKIVNGILHIALAGALALGFAFVFELLLGSGTHVFDRVIVFVLASLAFLSGYLSKGGADTGEKDAE
ncbi:hypothetical protein ACFQ3Y_24910 [Paenibacillus motobuensis]|uniref:hypothetical protein n=1 Tax=Paenibacillus motobuensis TaxID=295324 RepID=UPI00362F765D